MSDDGWIAVKAGDKRSRTIKYKKPATKKSRTESSSSDDDLVFNTQEPHPTLDLKPTKKKKSKKQATRTLHPDGITVKNLQELIFWIYDQGPNPAWIMVKDKHLVNKCVVVAVGGLNDAIWTTYAQHMPQMQSIFGDQKKITVAPGTETKVYSPLQALLYYHSKKKKKSPVVSTETVQQAPHPPQFYAHSLHALMNNGFPLRVKSIGQVDESTGKSGVTAEYEPLPGYRVYSQTAEERMPSQHMIAVDCEMCLTTEGSELARVTAVDMEGQVIYNQLVKPPNPVTDYLTRYSGMTKELLDPVTTTVSEVQEHLANFLYKDTILVGHSLENDLRAMKICHFNILDTSILFPHNAGPPAKNSLRGLAQQFLHRAIQVGNHDSAEDAIAAMELAKLKILRGPEFGVHQNNEDSIIEKLRVKGVPATILDRGSLVTAHCPNGGVVCESDEKVVETLADLLHSSAADAPKFVYTQLHDLNSFYRAQNGQQTPAEEAEETPVGKIEDVLKGLDHSLSQIYASLPADSFLIVTSGQANLATCSKLWKEKRENESAWTEDQSRQLRHAIETARSGITLFASKSTSS